MTVTTTISKSPAFSAGFGRSSRAAIVVGWWARFKPIAGFLPVEVRISNGCFGSVEARLTGCLAAFGGGLHPLVLNREAPRAAELGMGVRLIVLAVRKGAGCSSGLG